VESAALPCIGAAVAATPLLGMQEERPDRRAQRRGVADAAAAGLEGLSILQRELLGCATVSLAELELAAQEAEAHAQDADDRGKRLCLAVALRIRVEIAKRQPNAR
jgi:hypothetical protein